MKKIILPLLLLCHQTMVKAQDRSWHRKDLVQDSVNGISSERALKELLDKKKATPVIVAIIDSGIDTLHEALRPVLWTDPKTGIHGWNYIGAETGREDVTLLVAEKKELYDSLSYTLVPEIYKAGYQRYRKVAPALEYKIAAMEQLISQLDPVDSEIARSLKQKAKYHLEHGLNISNREADTARGDADVTPDDMAPFVNANPTPLHGTHVAGIINNLKYGIAPNAQLMMLKTNGNIRELREKSLAKAIRFAVDHGAKIINCSFGKPYTWDKKLVDEAVKYAMSKDVLIVHAAGNDGLDLEINENYPNPVYLDKGKAAAWLEVGACDKMGVIARFSNFGSSTVDVFAPGIDIYSTIPGNRYEKMNGTSMASPVVAGVAALIRGYYPKLTAVQVKEIIMKSVVKKDGLSDRCVSGGIVNAYYALKLAATYK